MVPDVPIDELIAILNDQKKVNQSRAISRWILLQAKNDDIAKQILIKALQPALAKFEASYKPWGRNMPDKQAWKQLCGAAAWVAVSNLAGRDLAWPLWALRNELRDELTREQNLQRSTETTPLNPQDIQKTQIQKDLTSPQDHTGIIDTQIEAQDLLSKAINAGHITLEEAQSIWRTRGLQIPTETAAKELGITPQTFRKRRSRAEQRLRSVA